MRICEHDTATLQCNAGEVIEITSADYGRVSRQHCQNGRYGVETRPMNPPHPCAHDITDIIADKYVNMIGVTYEF